MRAKYGLALVLGSALCAAAMAPAGCDKQRTREFNVQPTVAMVHVLHAGVTATPARGAAETPRVSSRIESGGRVATGPAGRAVVRTDDGLEIRLAGDTEISFPDGRPRLERGRAFVSSWGDEERTLFLGPDLTLGIGDSAAEIERTASGEVRAVAVRSEFAWRRADAQGRVQQGEELQGRGRTAEVRPAGVWDDWTGGAASPQGASERGALGSGEAMIHGEMGEAPSELAVSEQRVSVALEGDVAVTTVSQRFFNGADRTAPVEYRVRLPEGAIVSRFAVEQNGSTRIAAPGTVASLAENGGGHAALLAAPGGEGLFARLDPIAPGQTVRCELQYIEWLSHTDGRRTYVYPMGDAVSPPAVTDFAFEMTTLRANVGALRGPSGSTVDRGRLRYSRSDFRPRADLVVDVFDATPPEAAGARVWMSEADGNGQQYALVDVNVPPPPDQGTDLVVVLDVSGATDTGTLSAAGAAMNAVLHQLGPNDRVSLMFGDLGARAAPGAAGELAPTTDARREAILNAIARARPGGASNLERMLSDAYARLDPRRNGSVVYVGDAMPTMGPLDAERLADEALRASPDLRLYVLALGDDAHPEMLSRLAERGGLVEQASDQAEAVSAANRLAAHAMRPVLRDVTVRLGATVAHPLPDVMDLWVAGEPLRAIGELTGNPPEHITVTARQGAEQRRWAVSTRIDRVSDLGDVRRRWGLSRVRALASAGASRGALADLGVRFGLITPSSALVLGGGPVNGGGFEVAGSLWPSAVLHSRLPRLGVADEVEPRGVRALYEAPEYPMVTDDESGWARHGVGENAGYNDAMSLSLSAADDDARACIERSRALRPSVSGTVTVAATVAADGRITNAQITSSTLNDTGADSCVRRVVAGLTLPAPALYGAQPGTVSRTFDFSRPWVGRANRGCPPSSRLSRDARMVLWRERISAQRGQLAQVWSDAIQRCEIRTWEDRVGLVQLLARAADDPAELTQVRNALDGEVIKYFDRVVARRFGPSRVYRAYMAQARGYVDWDAFERRMNDPQTTNARRIELVRAYLLVAPNDMDLRLRLMALHEAEARTGPVPGREANMREARRVAAELRVDPYADTRVRALVGEMLIRAGDRDEALRALSEIAEHAPYDTNARAELGDLLLTYGGTDWANEAYLQYQTLAALRPGDPLPRVRVALAALVARREDEALRILRSVAEDSGGDLTTPAVEALLVSEVARIAASRGNDPAAQGWMRVANLMHIARDGGVVARWTNPEVVFELRALQAGDTAFVGVGEANSPLNVRVFSPGTALEGSRLLLRAVSGLEGARSATAHISVLRPGDRGVVLAERDVTLSPGTRVMAFVVRNGALVDDPTPIPESERPAPATQLY